MILTRIFDKIMDLKGDFNVLEFKIGKRKNELSYARLMVHGKNKKHLDQLLATLYIEGAQPVLIEEVLIKLAPEDMVMPSDFYSTTNNSTQIYYSNEWIDVRNMMMDKCIAIDIKLRTAECKMIREVRKGDMIVVGERGVKVLPEERHQRRLQRSHPPRQLLSARFSRPAVMAERCWPIHHSALRSLARP
jgi:hypothetical protein